MRWKQTPWHLDVGNKLGIQESHESREVYDHTFILGYVQLWRPFDLTILHCN